MKTKLIFILILISGHVINAQITSKKTDLQKKSISFLKNDTLNNYKLKNLNSNIHFKEKNESEVNKNLKTSPASLFFLWANQTYLKAITKSSTKEKDEQLAIAAQRFYLSYLIDSIGYIFKTDREIHNLWKKTVPQILLDTLKYYSFNLDTLTKHCPEFKSYYYSRYIKYFKKLNDTILISDYNNMDSLSIHFVKKYRSYFIHKRDSLKKELDKTTRLLGELKDTLNKTEDEISKLSKDSTNTIELKLNAERLQRLAKEGITNFQKHLPGSKYKSTDDDVVKITHIKKTGLPKTEIKMNGATKYIIAEYCDKSIVEYSALLFQHLISEQLKKVKLSANDTIQITMLIEGSADGTGGINCLISKPYNGNLGAPIDQKYEYLLYKGSRTSLVKDTIVNIFLRKNDKFRNG